MAANDRKDPEPYGDTANVRLQIPKSHLAGFAAFITRPRGSGESIPSEASLSLEWFRMNIVVV